MSLDKYKSKQNQTDLLVTANNGGVRYIYDEIKSIESKLQDEKSKQELLELKQDISLELAYVMEYGDGYLVEKGDTQSHINALLPEGFNIKLPDPRKLQSGKQLRVGVQKGLVYVKTTVVKNGIEMEIKEEIKGSTISWGSVDEVKKSYNSYRLNRWAQDCEMQLDPNNEFFIAENGELKIATKEISSLQDLRDKTAEYREKKADEYAQKMISDIEGFGYNSDTNEYYGLNGQVVILRDEVKDLKELKELILVKKEQILDNQARGFAQKVLIRYDEETKQYIIPSIEIKIPRDMIKTADDLKHIVDLEIEKFLTQRANDYAKELGIEYDEKQKLYVIPNTEYTIARDNMKSLDELKHEYQKIKDLLTKNSQEQATKKPIFEYTVKPGDGIIAIIKKHWKDLGLENNSQKSYLEYYNNYKQDIVKNNGLRVSKGGDPIILINTVLQLPVVGVVVDTSSAQQDAKISVIKENPVIEETKKSSKDEKVETKTQLEGQSVEIKFKETQLGEKKETKPSKTKVEVFHTQDKIDSHKIDNVTTPDQSNQSLGENQSVVDFKTENQTDNKTDETIVHETSDNVTKEQPKPESQDKKDDNSSIFQIPDFGIFGKIKKYTIEKQQALEGNVSIVVGHEDPSVRNKDKPKLVKPEQTEQIMPPKIDLPESYLPKPKTSVKAILKRENMKAQEVEIERVYGVRNLKHGYTLNQYHPDTVTKNVKEGVYMLSLDGANIEQYLDKNGNMLINVSKLIESEQFDYSALTAGYVMFKVDGKVALYKIKEITNDNDIVIGDKLEYFSESEFDAYKEIDMYNRFFSKYDSSIYGGLVDKVWLDEMLEADLLNVKFLFDLYMKSSIDRNIFQEYVRKVVDYLPDQLINGKLNKSGEYFTKSNLRELSRFGFNTNQKDLQVISFDNVKNGDYYRSRGIIPLCEPYILEHSLSILSNVKSYKGLIDQYKGDIKIMSSEIKYSLVKKNILLDADLDNHINEFVIGLKSFKIDEDVSLKLAKDMIESNLKPLDDKEKELLQKTIGSASFTKEKDFYDKFIGMGIPEFAVQKVLSLPYQLKIDEEQLNLFIMRLYLSLQK